MASTPTCTTCNSESVFWASSTALRAARSASSEPSVASRILVGKMLIASLSFPVDVPTRTCVNCINTLVGHKGTEVAQRCSRKATEAYSPNLVEAKFSEVGATCGGVRLKRIRVSIRWGKPRSGRREEDASGKGPDG